eukprot:scaffold24956_cov18-Tisochrysis_lutea.AAC.1
MLWNYTLTPWTCSEAHILHGPTWTQRKQCRRPTWTYSKPRHGATRTYSEACNCTGSHGANVKQRILMKLSAHSNNLDTYKSAAPQQSPLRKACACVLHHAAGCSNLYFEDRIIDRVIDQCSCEAWTQ